MVAGDHTEQAVALVGDRLKEARLRARITLDALAQECGVTKGYLSKLERDQVSPSVATLVRVCSALEVPVGSLFDPAPAGDVVRARARPQIVLGGERMTEYLLTPGGERRVQVLLGHIDPGGGSGAEAYELPIEVGVVHVLTGGLRVDFPDPDPAPDVEAVGSSVTLSAGDTFTFTPRRPHRFAAVGADPTRVLWVLTPGLPTDRGAQGNTS